MAAHRYWRLWCVENFGNAFAGNMAASSIELRVNSGGSNLSVTGNGTPSASAVGAAGFEADKAFDANTATYWYSGSVALPTWIKWDFGAGNAQDINHLTIINGTSPVSSQMIKRWTLQFSDDDVNWTPWMYSTTNNTSAQTNTPTSWAWSSDMVPSATVAATAPMLTFYARTGARAETMTVSAPTVVVRGGPKIEATAPMPTLNAFFGNRFELTLPSPEVLVEVDASTGNRLEVALPMPAIGATAGPRASAALPMPTLQMTGTTTILIEVSAALPMPTAAVQISRRGQITASSTLPMPTLLARGGAQARNTMSAPTLVMSGKTGSVISVQDALPMPTAAISVTSQPYVSAVIEAALPMLVPGPYTRIISMLPMPQLAIDGRTVVAVTYETYAVNLKPKARFREEPVNEVTRYTNYPFEQIVTYQGNTYGVGPTGLFLLGGSTDYASPTPTAIPWAWKTALSDNDKPQLKTPLSVYFSGRVGAAATVTLYAGESGNNAYTYTTPRDANPQSYRQKFGRGLKTRYMALGMSGTTALEIDKIDLEVSTLQRKL